MNLSGRLIDSSSAAAWLSPTRSSCGAILHDPKREVQPGVGLQAQVRRRGAGEELGDAVVGEAPGPPEDDEVTRGERVALVRVGALQPPEPEDARRADRQGNDRVTAGERRLPFAVVDVVAEAPAVAGGVSVDDVAAPADPNGMKNDCSLPPDNTRDQNTRLWSTVGL